MRNSYEYSLMFLSTFLLLVAVACSTTPSIPKSNSDVKVDQINFINSLGYRTQSWECCSFTECNKSVSKYPHLKQSCGTCKAFPNVNIYITYHWDLLHEIIFEASETFASAELLNSIQQVITDEIRKKRPQIDITELSENPKQLTVAFDQFCPSADPKANDMQNLRARNKKIKQLLDFSMPIRLSNERSGTLRLSQLGDGGCYSCGAVLSIVHVIHKDGIIDNYYGSLGVQRGEFQNRPPIKRFPISKTEEVIVESHGLSHQGESHNSKTFWRLDFDSRKLIDLGINEDEADALGACPFDFEKKKWEETLEFSERERQRKIYCYEQTVKLKRISNTKKAYFTFEQITKKRNLDESGKWEAWQELRKKCDFEKSQYVCR